MLATRRQAIALGAAALVAGAAPRRAWAATEADVIIIGAGLAGLHAAWMLEQAGLRVVVIEGSNRIGGRLHTLDDLPGHPEAGGVQVGSGYARLIGHAERLAVPLISGGDEPRDALYRVNGPAHGALNAAESAIPPAALGGLYARRLPALASPDAWRDPANIAALDRPYSAVLRELGASDEAIRLINTNLNGNSVDTLSALHVARTAAIFRSMPGAVRTIGGGSQRLPEAMAAALNTEVRFGQRVVGIVEERGGMLVGTSLTSVIRARHVICTIPFSLLRAMVVNRWRGQPMPAAVHSTPYTRAAFLYLSARTPFWREDGLAATLWSDDPLVGRVFVLGDDPPMLKVWIAGPWAEQADRMAPDALASAVMARIEAARPSARGQLALARHFSWQQQPFANGIYHHIGSGKAADLAAATALAGHRLHFAGEHLAVAASGMEGALESGERAARAVLAAD